MKALAEQGAASQNRGPITWLQREMDNLRETSTHQDTEVTEAEDEKATLVAELIKQQESLQRQITDITGSSHPKEDTLADTLRQAIGAGGSKQNNQQDILIDQLRAALAPKEEDKDPNKVLIKALLTNSNKTIGPGGTSTLKTDLLKKLSGEGEFSMAEWLASLNKQEEGESEVLRLLNREDVSDCSMECKHGKFRSGMLDKSTTNIRHKEIWPQKNLREDWAEEEMEFKQLRFEHLVAGETRTIETCSDPAQILGRLRLLRRIAYLKLRGIEWHLLRKMYAAILSSRDSGVLLGIKF